MTKAIESMGRWAAVNVLLLAGLLLAGCQMGGSGGFAPVPAPEVATAKNPTIDLLKPSDTITITYADTPTPIPAFEGRINEDGTITLIQNQVFQAAGKTRSQLEQEIRDRYVPRFFKYLTVTVNQLGSTQFYYVNGDVKQPGRQVYLSRITVLKAIASAGDFTDFAKKTKVVLTREDGRKFTINCIEARTHPEQDLEVYPGDQIFVPRKFW